ncbi:protein lin-9 homolog [Drosophila subpulchrella]|uniref:protein lin-9 homolog n=1 Tax=Drosophila subpulchrella TaxID=1486046 RepID=UPI0018A14103|nr:protein lin-9 homolog [Drosophila subpulchrella]
MSIEPQTIKVSKNQTENYEEKEFLANIGLLATTTMAEIRQRQQKKPKKPKQDCEEDDLFVKRPDFSKRNLMVDEVASQLKTETKEWYQNDGCSSEEEGEEKEETHTICSIPGKRLYNFLQQLSSHQWIWCEFVDSFLDKPILACSYDMERFICECCPMLKTRYLPRRGWQLLRRNMGKARRFSPAFIEQERQEMERSRRIVRQLQQYRFNHQEDGPYLELLPKRIPLPLAPDAKVVGLLQGHSLRGIIAGHVMDYDPQDSSYLVRFSKNGTTAVLSLQDSRLYTDQDNRTLPLSIMMHGIKSAPFKTETAKNEKFGNKRYTKELLESVLQVRKLLDVKQKTVMEISQMNENFEGGKDSSTSGSRRDAKMTPQREKLQRRYAANMITLHRVNSDVLEPLHTLYEHLAEYQKQEEEQEAKGGRPASEVYQKCRMQAELDLKTVGSEKSLKIESDRIREFVCNLQTILYLNGKMGRENSADMEAVLADLISHMKDNVPPALGVQFEDALMSLNPLRQQVVAMFKAIQKPERFQITQQAPMQTEDGVYNFVVEAQPDPPA